MLRLHSVARHDISERNDPNDHDEWKPIHYNPSQGRPPGFLVMHGAVSGHEDRKHKRRKIHSCAKLQTASPGPTSITRHRHAPLQVHKQNRPLTASQSG